VLTCAAPILRRKFRKLVVRGVFPMPNIILRPSFSKDLDGLRRSSRKAYQRASEILLEIQRDVEPSAPRRAESRIPSSSCPMVIGSCSSGETQTPRWSHLLLEHTITSILSWMGTRGSSSEKQAACASYDLRPPRKPPLKWSRLPNSRQSSQAPLNPTRHCLHGQLERLVRSGARFAAKAMVLSAASNEAAIKIGVRRIGPALGSACGR
jgi:hypothetical protein